MQHAPLSCFSLSFCPSTCIFLSFSFLPSSLSSHPPFLSPSLPPSPSFSPSLLFSLLSFPPSLPLSLPTSLQAHGFLDKNRDTFSADLFDLLHMSRSDFIAELFRGEKAMVRLPAQFPNCNGLRTYIIPLS